MPSLAHQSLLPTSALHSTNRLRRRVRPRRGATVLIVILVLGMLTSVGLFAARAAQVGISNAGRIRQSTQTHFLSEMGVLTALSEFERDPVVYKNRLSNAAAVPPTSTGKRACTSVPYLNGITNSTTFKPADERCIRIGDDTIQARAQQTIPGLNVVTARSATGPTPGGLGLGETVANFAAEVTDLTEVPVPVTGYSVGSTITTDMRLYRVTVLATGQILPTNSAGAPFALETEESRYLTSLEQTRAHLVIGPVK
jgi:hypothetical protein